MQISRKSWHYRFLTGFVGKPDYKLPRSLCPYVRMLLFNLIGVTLIATVAVNVVIGAFFVWYSLFFMPEGLTLSDVGHVYFALGIVAQAVALVFGFVISWVEWSDDLFDLVGRGLNKVLPKREPNFTGMTKPKTPSVFWEYVKARKKKLCPLIDFAE